MEFKDIPWKDKISEDDQIAVYLDKYPVTKGHVLVVPKYNNLTTMAEAFKYAISIGRHQVAIGEWDFKAHARLWRVNINLPNNLQCHRFQMCARVLLSVVSVGLTPVRVRRQVHSVELLG